MSKNYVTQEGLRKMNEELNHLVTHETKVALEMLSEARDKGDLSENAEYEAAREYNNNLSNKIQILKDRINNAQVIKATGDLNTIGMLSKVVVENINIKKTMEWHLVPEGEGDVKIGKISFTSPIGSALIGKTRGDLVTIQVPSGTVELKVIDIK
jgi:transcription elongation factor GreA